MVDRALIRQERHERATVALEPCGAEQCSGRLVAAVRQLLEPPLHAGRTQESSDALDGLGPHVANHDMPHATDLWSHAF